MKMPPKWEAWGAQKGAKKGAKMGYPPRTPPREGLGRVLDGFEEDLNSDRGRRGLVRWSRSWSRATSPTGRLARARTVRALSAWGFRRPAGREDQDWRKPDARRCALMGYGVSRSMRAHLLAFSSHLLTAVPSCSIEWDTAQHYYWQARHSS